MSRDDFDDFDVLLRDVLQQPRRAAPASCPPPETLAAFVDDGLSAPERRKTEEHLARCPECRNEIHLLAEPEVEPAAAAAQAKPTPPEPKRAPRRSWIWPSWLRPAPIAAFATAVVAVALGIRFFDELPTPAMLAGRDAPEAKREAAAPEAQQRAAIPERAPAAPALLPRAATKPERDAGALEAESAPAAGSTEPELLAHAISPHDEPGDTEATDELPVDDIGRSAPPPPTDDAAPQGARDQEKPDPDAPEEPEPAADAADEADSEREKTATSTRDEDSAMGVAAAPVFEPTTGPTSEQSPPGKPERPQAELDESARAPKEAPTSAAPVEREPSEPAKPTPGTDVSRDSAAYARSVEGQAEPDPARDRFWPPAESDTSQVRRAPTPAASSRAEAAAPAEAPQAAAPRKAGPFWSPGDATESLEIRTSNARVSWRIRDGNVVEKTTDAGESWKTEIRVSHAKILSGRALGTSECWLVGERGLILHHTPRGGWTRIPSPTENDLVSVRPVPDGRVILRDRKGTRWIRNPETDWRLY